MPEGQPEKIVLEPCESLRRSQPARYENRHYDRHLSHDFAPPNEGASRKNAHQQRNQCENDQRPLPVQRRSRQNARMNCFPR